MAKKARGGPEEWIPLPLDKGLFANVDADAVVSYETVSKTPSSTSSAGSRGFRG